MKLDKWIESVPNFSEGRDLKKVERIELYSTIDFQ